jgi:hypothetical protein
MALDILRAIDFPHFDSAVDRRGESGKANPAKDRAAH